MTKEQAKIKEETEVTLMLAELSKMPSQVIATAYVYAKNITAFGVDVTKLWDTTAEQATALERAYHDGYRNALKRMDRDYSNGYLDALRSVEKAIEKLKTRD
jgi:hypothetical protein